MKFLLILAILLLSISVVEARNPTGDLNEPDPYGDPYTGETKPVTADELARWTAEGRAIMARKERHQKAQRKKTMIGFGILLVIAAFWWMERKGI